MLSTLPAETLQRLVDYAHAAMGKREGYPDDYAMNSSRSPTGVSILFAKDLRELQNLAPPSWEQKQQ